MASEKGIMKKGFVFVMCALPLMFSGPAVIHFAFINKHQPLHWAILILGIAMCFSGVVLVFKGLLKIVNSIF